MERTRAGAVRLERRPVEHPVSRALETRHVADMDERYHDGGPSPLQSPDFEPPEGAFLVAYRGDQPAACGGFRRLTGGTAELACLYVLPEHRRQGLARRLLEALEAQARRSGYRELWLAAGTEQPEALALYGSAGYRPIPPFGEFAGDLRTRCLGRSLEDVAP